MSTTDCDHTALFAFCILDVQLLFSVLVKLKAKFLQISKNLHLAEGHLLLGLDFSYHMFHILHTSASNEPGWHSHVGAADE